METLLARHPWLGISSFKRENFAGNAKLSNFAGTFGCILGKESSPKNAKQL